MTDQRDERIIRDWAVASATVVLTRRNDLSLFDPGMERELGLDLVVRIERGEGWERPTFGVIALAAYPEIDISGANAMLVGAARQFTNAMKSARPVCALVFSTNETQSFFSWIVEPVLTDGGRARLSDGGVPDCQPLTNQLVERAVDRVDAWWEVLRSVKQPAQTSTA